MQEVSRMHSTNCGRRDRHVLSRGLVIDQAMCPLCNVIGLRTDPPTGNASSTGRHYQEAIIVMSGDFQHQVLMIQHICFEGDQL